MGGTVRPIERTQVQIVFPLEQSFDDQEAETEQEEDEPVGESEKWDKLANKHEELQKQGG